MRRLHNLKFSKSYDIIYIEIEEYRVGLTIELRNTRRIRTMSKLSKIYDVIEDDDEMEYER